MDFVSVLEYPLPRTLAFILGLVAVLAIGVVDFVTGYEISMFVFYVCPIVAVAWYGDKKLAVLLAIIAGITWWWADEMASHPYRSGWLHGWETGVRLFMFLFSALSGALIKAHYVHTKDRIELLERSQRLEKEIIAASEQEQRRLGQDLHDGICQRLTALRYSVSSLHADLRDAGFKKWALVAQDLRECLKESVNQVRDLARGLVPVEIDDIGLEAALEQLMSSSSRLLNMQCRFRCQGDFPSLNYNAAINLYRIAQEAMNNAVKHGGGGRIDVTLDASGSQTELRIENDGSSFIPDFASKGGLGLKIMQYRSRSLGGELRIEPNPSGGTIVRCLIPRGGTSSSIDHDLLQSAA
jgi:signal transduction histidine kinase